MKVIDATLIDWINANVYIDETNIDNFNIVPFLSTDEVDVDYINDIARSFADEPPLLE